jgi:hypothetical protein
MLGEMRQPETTKFPFVIPVDFVMLTVEVGSPPTYLRCTARQAPPDLLRFFSRQKKKGSAISGTPPSLSESRKSVFCPFKEPQAMLQANADSDKTAVRFPLGKLVATPAAIEAMNEAGQSPHELFQRHQRGD